MATTGVLGRGAPSTAGAVLYRVPAAIEVAVIVNIANRTPGASKAASIALLPPDAQTPGADNYWVFGKVVPQADAVQYKFPLGPGWGIWCAGADELVTFTIAGEERDQ
jgi:hypothetical protein